MIKLLFMKFVEIIYHYFKIQYTHPPLISCLRSGVTMVELFLQNIKKKKMNIDFKIWGMSFWPPASTFNSIKRVSYTNSRPRTSSHTIQWALLGFDNILPTSCICRCPRMTSNTVRCRILRSWTVKVL